MFTHICSNLTCDPEDWLSHNGQTSQMVSYMFLIPLCKFSSEYAALFCFWLIRSIVRSRPCERLSSGAHVSVVACGIQQYLCLPVLSGTLKDKGLQKERNAKSWRQSGKSEERQLQQLKINTLHTGRLSRPAANTCFHFKRKIRTPVMYSARVKHRLISNAPKLQQEKDRKIAIFDQHMHYITYSLYF